MTQDDFYLIENGIYTITSAIEHIFENMLTANNGSDHDAFLSFQDQSTMLRHFWQWNCPSFLFRGISNTISIFL